MDIRLSQEYLTPVEAFIVFGANQCAVRIRNKQ